ncbi:bifunctional folylpolyglutamate synthase/dihydrofolate synthase [Alkalicoccobacillus porphyridii]|uniref:Dihydrofolate synthase/folylpolyglutamate synthase n=1 Tax=Alkalicoccobacillus porphyridii TaxID=2597270 RepID=A0A553ZXR9_9BACI|nr:folylpolyglutamate synthase/dihydrofolate synthase family protein [Alkalicoccobacillus porphyridii]TSB46249.1 bifunctional folylpolyglutamate synthase/dihydrofolate synthase [Alkalicoccobacillus porphyridii]
MISAERAIEWIHSLLPFGIKPGLKRMDWMLEKLGNPESKLNMIHVAGTNGKGSTVSFMRHMLEANGYKVGTFTSPYLECFEERISLNGVPISEKDLVAAANKVRPLVEELAQTELESPTEFEVITVIMFEHFAHVAKPDIVLVEVGLGGRLDSTNVIKPLLSVITSIGHDHMHILGSTIEEIAREKAGIIKKRIPVISGVTNLDALTVLRETAIERDTSFNQLNEDFYITDILINQSDQSFTFDSPLGRLTQLKTTMQGEHQLANASLALMALLRLREHSGFEITDAACKKGLAHTNWPGRFEKLMDQPLLIADGAHNEEGMKALATTLQNHYPNHKVTMLAGLTQEKDVATLMAPFKNLDIHITWTGFDFFRAAEPEDLLEATPDEIEAEMQLDWRIALEHMLDHWKKDELILVTGSLYFISEVRGGLKKGEELRKVNMV